MKPLFFILTVLIYLTSFASVADQRCDADTWNCHLSLDPNDDDTEVDFPASLMSSAGISRTLVDGVRTADGWYLGFVKIPMDTINKHDFLTEGEPVYRKGADSTATNHPYVVAGNTACNVVRSNYQENTGSDDQNQTEYTTNNWRLIMTWYNKMGGAFGEYGIWHASLYCDGGKVQ